MSRILGLVLAGGLLLGSAATSQAQFGLTIGNPYAGRGISIGAPSYGYNGGYGYNSGYNGGYGYNSGYSGYGGGYGYAPTYAVPYRPVYAAPVYAYPSYGYGGYGYNRGYVGGFRPYRRW